MTTTQAAAASLVAALLLATAGAQTPAPESWPDDGVRSGAPAPWPAILEGAPGPWKTVFLDEDWKDAYVKQEAAARARLQAFFAEKRPDCETEFKPAN